MWKKKKQSKRFLRDLIYLQFSEVDVFFDKTRLEDISWLSYPGGLWFVGIGTMFIIFTAF